MVIKTKEELKQLEPADWKQGVQLMFSADADVVGPNKFRNIENYKLNPTIIKSLKESIKASVEKGDPIERGLWWNNEFAVFGIPDASLIEFDDEGYITRFPHTSSENEANGLKSVMRISGHHRGEAAKQLGFKYYAGTVRIVTNDIMFRMMANENMVGTNNTPVTQMETVKQACEIIEGYANEFDAFGAVEEAHPGVFASEQAWKQVKRQGAGKKTITSYIGKPCTETMVSYTLRLIKNVERNVFTVDDVGKLPSISVANATGTLMSNLHDDKAWPVYFKDSLSKGVLDAVTNANSIATVKVITDAKDFMMNQDANPVVYLRRKQQEKFDLNAEIKKILKTKAKAAAENGETFDSASLLSEGFEGFAEAITKAVEELKAPASSVPETDEGAAATSDAVDEATSGMDLPETPSVDALNELSTSVSDGADETEAGEVSVPATIKSFIEAAYAAQILLGRMGDMDIDYANEGNEPIKKCVLAVLTAFHAFATKNYQESEDAAASDLE